YAKPVGKGKLCSEYRYQFSAIRCLGDLRTRLVGGEETLNSWDVEALRFALLRAPAWIKIDENTGLLSGTPDAPTKAQVIVTATIEREARKLDERQLSWGIENVVSSTIQKTGSTTQEFVIEVVP